MAFVIQEPSGKLTGSVRAQETRSDERQLQPLQRREFLCKASVSDVSDDRGWCCSPLTRVPSLPGCFGDADGLVAGAWGTAQFTSTCFAFLMPVF